MALITAVLEVSLTRTEWPVAAAVPVIPCPSGTRKLSPTRANSRSQNTVAADNFRPARCHQHAKDFKSMCVDLRPPFAPAPRPNLQRGVHFFADSASVERPAREIAVRAVQCDCCRMFIRWIHEV